MPNFVSSLWFYSLKMSSCPWDVWSQIKQFLALRPRPLVYTATSQLTFLRIFYHFLEIWESRMWNATRNSKAIEKWTNYSKVRVISTITRTWRFFFSRHFKILYTQTRNEFASVLLYQFCSMLRSFENVTCVYKRITLLSVDITVNHNTLSSEQVLLSDILVVNEDRPFNNNTTNLTTDGTEQITHRT